MGRGVAHLQGISAQQVRSAATRVRAASHQERSQVCCFKREKNKNIINLLLFCLKSLCYYIQPEIMEFLKQFNF